MAWTWPFLVIGCGHSPPPSKVTWTPSQNHTQAAKKAKKNAEQRPSPRREERREERKPLSVTAPTLAPHKKADASPVRQTTLLATLSNDYKARDTRDLMVVTDAQNQIVSIQIRNNRKKRTKTYPVEKLREKIPLAKTAGITLIELRCLNFRPKHGCTVQIEYPYNITYGSFRQFRTELKLQDGKWGFYQSGQRFQGIHMVAKKLFGLLVGIQEIQLR